MLRTNLSSKQYRKVRTSQRGLEQKIIRVVILGNGSPEQISYNNQKLSKDEITRFVAEKINTGLQMVCLPMPPLESHSLIVEVISESSVNIVDWGGEITRNMKEDDWINYTTFIKCLEKKYKRVTYYPIDKDINKIANKRCKTNHGQGGCSEYVHNWINKYIGEEGKKAIIYTF